MNDESRKQGLIIRNVTAIDNAGNGVNLNTENAEIGGIFASNNGGDGVVVNGSETTRSTNSSSNNK